MTFTANGKNSGQLTANSYYLSNVVTRIFLYGELFSTTDPTKNWQFLRLKAKFCGCFMANDERHCDPHLSVPLSIT